MQITSLDTFFFVPLCLCVFAFPFPRISQCLRVLF